MLKNVSSQQNRLLFFIFSSSISCGIVFFGILVGFGYMLGEQGFSTSTITSLFLATLPYSFKFAISPFVKNIILKFQDCGLNTIKMLAYITECIIIIGVAFFGIYTKESSHILIFFHILAVVLAGSIHDLIGDYLRLSYFQGKLLGTATSLGTVGFRIGMLFSSAGMLYMASFLGWKLAFIFISSVVLISVISTFTLKNENVPVKEERLAINSVKTYIKFCTKLFKEYNLLIILLLTLSFKFSDSCINGLKTVFMQSRGFSKIDFANISQIIGIFVIMLSGAISASFTYKYSIRKCMKYTFILQLIPSLCFIFLAVSNKLLITETAILLSITTFFLGFTSVIYRVYISEISNSDINIYTVLLSIGSIFRSLSLYVAGYIVDIFTWETLYIICLLSNIPGMLVCFSKLYLKDNYSL